MQALTLQELFGVNATQTATELVIKKADLAAVGLTPTANNRAEQLVVAIVLKALQAFQGYLVEENGEKITDELNNSINYDNQGFSELIEVFLWGTYIPENLTSIIRYEIIFHSYTPGFENEAD